LPLSSYQQQNGKYCRTDCHLSHWQADGGQDDKRREIERRYTQEECVISGFRLEVDETALFTDFTQRIVAITDVSGPDRLSRNVGKHYHYTPRDIPEQRISHAGRSRNNNNALDFNNDGTLMRRA
jgi:hypothetical protein